MAYADIIKNGSSMGVISTTHCTSLSYTLYTQLCTCCKEINYVKKHPDSVIAEDKREMEGIVCRPAVELRDRRGNRVIVKIKWEDIKELI